MSARIAIILVAAIALCAGTSRAGRADPYRLRASALAQSQSPVGLVVLESEGTLRPWLSGEALVWTGAGGDTQANVLVIALHARSQDRRREATLGRFVVSSGALRPVHIDGVAARVRLPWRSAVEVFGGMPVVPGLDGRAYDWLVGGRVSRSLGDWGSAGVAYLHRRDHGRLADEELGLDAGGAASERLDLAGRLAWDLVSPGVSELLLSAGWRHSEAWRIEAFASHRSPARILPATSLFSVLGDVPARTLGTTVRWRAAPRLDLIATGAGRAMGDGGGGALGVELMGRAVLRLDDRGAGAIHLEARREAAPDGGWSGIRAAGRVPLRERWSAATELELVVPDQARGRGRVWPWALAALRWRPAPAWQAAAAIEASASPQYTSRVDVLVTVTRTWMAGAREGTP